MKKFISIALIFAIAAPFWISYSVIQYQKHTVRKEIKRQIINGLDKNDLVLLKFSSTESNSKLKWEHDKEFEYSGIMYDVIESKTKGDSVYYWCWQDDDETELNGNINTLAAQAMAKRNHAATKHFVGFLSALFYSRVNTFNFDGNDYTENFPSLNVNFYLSQTADPPIPPPKINAC